MGLRYRTIFGEEERKSEMAFRKRFRRGRRRRFGRRRSFGYGRRRRGRRTMRIGWRM